MIRFFPIISISLVLMFSSLLLSCNNTTINSNLSDKIIEGNGKVVSETRTIPKGFDKVQISSSIELEL